MKLARVKPLHKGGDHVPDQFRLISLLPVISKVLEKIVYNNMMMHIETNEILYCQQYGFRKNHSTCDAVVNLASEILTAFGNDHMVLSVFIDLRKAFDSVSHGLIIEKLRKIGVDGVELEWFRSYLTDRYQRVDINSSSSELKRVTVGVPQGSLLGVVLFSLVINSLYTSLRYATGILYADDTTLLIAGRSLRFLKLKMQSDLNALASWLRTNKLKLNVSKTKSMLFNRQGLTPHVSLNIENEEIGMVDNFKFLGVILDCSMTFEHQYKCIYDKLLKASYLLRKLSLLVPLGCLKQLYFAYFDSHLSYCNLVWYPMLPKKLQDSLFRLQKRLVRTLSKVALNVHCMPLFQKHGILTIEDSVKISHCKLIHRVVNDSCAKPLIRIFRHDSSRGLSRNVNLTVPRHTLNGINRSFLCRSIYAWQTIENSIKQVLNVKLFSKKLKKEMLKKY